MNLEESYRVLGINSQTSEEDRFVAYDELREKLNAKLANAPTEGLKAKYAEGLKRLDEAIECVESNFDAKELPILGVAASPPPNAAHRREKPVTNSNVGPKRRSRAKPLWIVFFIAVLASLVILSKVAWDRHLENEQQRLAAIERTRIEEVRKAELAAAQSRIEPLRRPYRVFSENLESMQQDAKERLDELETAHAVAKREGSREEQEISAMRLERFEAFHEWLVSYLGEYAVGEKLAAVEKLIQAGSYEEARAALEEPVPDISKLRGEIEIAEEEQYEGPVRASLAKREFSRALADSEKALERFEYERAIDFVKPYEKDPYVEEQVKSKLDELYQLKAEDALNRARHAAEIGEFPLARSILDSLEDDPVSGEQSKAQLELVERLNSEYALEEALTASRRAVEQNAFELARRELAFLGEDPHVGERVKSELLKVEARIAEWQEQEAAKMRALEELAAQERETRTNQGGVQTTPDFDTPPRLLSKTEPLYPDLLRQSNVSGYVELEWEIGVNGRARNVGVLSSSRKEFEMPAIEAVKRWRFQPAQKDDRPVPAKVRQKLLFNPR